MPSLMFSMFIDKSKVVFSAGLQNPGINADIGPFNTDTILKYRKVFTNIGNAYSPNTGTASELYAQLKSVCASVLC